MDRKCEVCWLAVKQLELSYHNNGMVDAYQTLQLNFDLQEFLNRNPAWDASG